MLPEQTSMDLQGPISSRESADGISRFNSQDGQQTKRCGPDRAPVSHIRLPEGAEGMRMSATYGPFSADSSPLVALQQSLESGLLVRMAAFGSMESALTWRRWVMPSGRRICALRASVRRTSDRDFIGWPTPTARDGRTLKGARDRPGRQGGASLSHLVLKCWATPRANKYGNADSHGNYQKPLSAEMDGVELNPAFNRWLMGFPEEWAKSAPTVMPSSRKSQRNS